LLTPRSTLNDGVNEPENGRPASRPAYLLSKMILKAAENTQNLGGQRTPGADSGLLELRQRRTDRFEWQTGLSAPKLK